MSASGLVAERERLEGRPFALFAGRWAGASTRLALQLRPVIALPIEAANTQSRSAASTVASLRAAAAAAFASGAKGLVVCVAHEAAALFDRIAVHPPWSGLPGIELWAAEEVIVADSREEWAVSATPRLQGSHFDHESMSALRDWHRGAVDEICARIAAGDVYQACLTFPVEFAPLESLGTLFSWLMHKHPVDHGAWVSLPQLELASCSPELLFSLQGRTVVTRPMKGTRRIGANDSPLQVARILEELQHAPKDRAENVMIADLLRNDLGRVCKTGTVRASALWQVERFASVAQMTSTIEGELLAGLDVWDVLGAVFPPGSMTGAPKIAACELLRKLERGPRGLYGGALGWIEPSGDAQFSVVIRSLQQRQGRARWDVGGGIVHDSSAQSEWLEAWAKIAVLEPLWAHAPPAGVPATG